MEGATRRVPAIADAGVTRMINGPEAFTPDNEFILGESRGARAASWPPGSARTASRARAASAAGGAAGSSTASPSSTSGRWTSAGSGGNTGAELHPGAELRELRHLLRHPLPERGAAGGAGRSALSPAYDELVALGAVLRREVDVGARELVRRPTRRARACPPGPILEALRPPGWAGRALEPCDRCGGAGDPDDGGAVRRVERSRRSRSTARGGGPPCSMAVTTTSTATVGQHHELHPDAQPSRRDRMRPHRDRVPPTAS